MPNYRTRGRGEGKVWKDERYNVYRGRVQVNGKRESVTAATEGAAHKMLDALIADAPETPEADNNPTVGAWLAYWVDNLADTDSENNRANRKWAIDKLSALHPKRMNAVLRPDVEKVLRGYAAKGYKQNTVIRMRSVLAMAYDTYNGRNGRTFNPARGAKYGKAEGTAAKRALTPKQTAKFLEAADNTPRYGILVSLGVWLGMRPGEVAGLTWDAVNLNTGELSIRQMRRRDADGTLTMVDPKADSFRNLTAPTPLLESLRRHKAAQAAEGLWSHKGLVVCTRAGRPLDPSNARREVAKIAAAAGIFFHVTPNELRHTAASLLVNSGVPKFIVADMLGHKNTRMLDQTYRHKDLRPVDTSAAMVAAIGTSAAV